MLSTSVKADLGATTQRKQHNNNNNNPKKTQPVVFDIFQVISTKPKPKPKPK
jgi:hypothetical protein